MDGFGALSFVQIEFGKNGIDSMSKTLNFGSFRLNRINVFVDELGRQVSKRFFKVGKFWRVVSNWLADSKWFECDMVCGHFDDLKL